MLLHLHTLAVAAMRRLLSCGVVAMASAGHGSLNVCLCTFRSQHTATASLAVASTCSGVSVSAVPVRAGCSKWLLR